MHTIDAIVSYSRHAVVHPWGPNPGPEAPGKELYLIPILPHETLPDYVEILDLVKFPKQREEKMLLGVFVLNRGKFSERIPPVTQVPSAAKAAHGSDITPAAPGVPIPSNGPASNPTSSAPQTAQPTIPPEIVSKLTAEQIESLLQSVLSGGLNAIPTTQPQLAAPPVSTAYPSTFPSLTNLLPQQYPSISYPPYSLTGPQGASPYPPLPTQQPTPMPYNFSPNLYALPALTPRYN